MTTTTSTLSSDDEDANLDDYDSECLPTSRTLAGTMRTTRLATSYSIEQVLRTLAGAMKDASRALPGFMGEMLRTLAGAMRTGVATSSTSRTSYCEPSQRR